MRPRADVVDLLLDTGVDLVLTGHEHLYQRTRPLALGPGLPRDQPGELTAAGSSATGAGTTFVTVGTGGHDCAVHRSDTERRSSRRWQGEGRPSFGSLDVQVTADRLTARFVPVGRGYLHRPAGVHPRRVRSTWSLMA